MAFSYTKKVNDITASRVEVFGTYTNTGGSTGGDIATGLFNIEFVAVQPSGGSVIATQSVASVSGSTVTITTSANESGYWKAVGY